MSLTRYLLKFSYIGTPFRGSQRQVPRNNLKLIDPTTVQGRIEMGLERLNPVNDPIVYMASRTDSGVHALNTACHVDLRRYNDENYEPDTVTICLNRYFDRENLPIRILNTSIVSKDFNARWAVLSRTYLYRVLLVLYKHEKKSLKQIHFQPIEEYERSFMMCTNTFDIKKMRAAAKQMEGFHDFRSFMATSRDKSATDKVTRRFIHSIDIVKKEIQSIGVSSKYSWPGFIHSDGQDNEWNSDNEAKYLFLNIYIKGKGFLYKQVRRIAGILLAAATDRMTKEEIRILLEVPAKESWDSKVRTLPAYGLYLCEVEY